MKRQWIALASVAVGFSLSTLGASAQGPQGVGASTAAQAANPSHSYNPIKWVKKQPHTATESLDANSDQNTKLTTKLQVQGLLPANADLKETCSSIKDLGECVAALHAAHNLALDFSCLKSKMSGVQASLSKLSCSSATDGKPVTLSKAIHALKPDANAKTEAKNAERQSSDDLREART